MQKLNNRNIRRDQATGWLRFIFGSLMVGYTLTACTGYKPKSDAKVSVRKVNGTYFLYKDEQPFIVKGAAGSEQLRLLRQIGGNTIRLWDTVGLAVILKEAHELGISVIVGLPIPESQYMEYYNDAVKVARQHAAIKALVNKYKDEPALLMWCVGNELSFPNKPRYLNFYKAFNSIVDMIHRDDPDHPVTTTMVNFQRKDVFNIRMRTDVDIISFNIFGRIERFLDDVESFSWVWRGPYLITEWGIDGPWEGTPQTPWGAWIEPTSTTKAAQYRQRYRQQMPINDRGFLGSLIFYWGQKQETTHTWFSLFDEHGNKTEAVAAAEEIWSGRTTLPAPPSVSDMLLDGKLPGDPVFLDPSTSVHAQIHLLSGDSGFNKIEWEVYAEDWYKSNERNNTIRPSPLKGLITSNLGLEATFVTPSEEGPYRIFATVYDEHDNIATCNSPFYVVGTDAKK